MFEFREKVRSVCVCCQDDVLGLDVSTRGVQHVCCLHVCVMCGSTCLDLCDRCLCLQVEASSFDKLFEDESDKLVGPKATSRCCERCCCCCTIYPMPPQFFLVCYHNDILPKLRSLFLQLSYVFSSCFSERLGPKGSAAGRAAPFTLDVVFLDVRSDSVDVAQFECCDIWSRVEEKRLAMTSVLQSTTFTSTDDFDRMSCF